MTTTVKNPMEDNMLATDTDRPMRTESARHGNLQLEVTNLTAMYGNNVAVSDVNFEVVKSEFVTLLGPSGCGKTTTLRCVAGLHRVSDGAIQIAGTNVATGTSHVPPNDRDINMVFQSYAVWPHMTVFDNVAYGVRQQRLGKTELKRQVGEMLELVGLGAYEKRYATELSGGQQQRVALARALAPRPGLVLMDEPLSNLDARLRARMRHEIREIQKATGTTILYVTHDQEEALSMSDRILVMRDGAVMQEGDPWTLYNFPQNQFVADFLGDANSIPATVVSTPAGDHFMVQCTAVAGSPPIRVTLRPGDAPPQEGDHITVVFRPEWAQVVTPDADTAKLENLIPVKIDRSEFLGSQTEALFTFGDVSIRVELSSAQLRRNPRLQETEYLRVPADALVWFRREP